MMERDPAQAKSLMDFFAANQRRMRFRNLAACPRDAHLLHWQSNRSK